MILIEIVNPLLFKVLSNHGQVKTINIIIDHRSTIF